MSWQNFRIRRATLDDLGQLTRLWDSMNYPSGELARRVTEFQVAEAENGVLAGALGLQTLDRQGLLHSEAFLDFALADHLRGLLMERMMAVADNQHLLRFWTREAAPYWTRSSGLARADEEAAASLPAAWKEGSGAWLTLKLREDLEEIIRTDAAVAAIMEQAREAKARVVGRGKFIRALVAFLAFVVAAFAFAAALYLLWKRQRAQL